MQKNNLFWGLCRNINYSDRYSPLPSVPILIHTSEIGTDAVIPHIRSYSHLGRSAAGQSPAEPRWDIAPQKSASSIWWPVGEFDQQKCWVRRPLLPPSYLGQSAKKQFRPKSHDRQKCWVRRPYWPGLHFGQERQASCLAYCLGRTPGAPAQSASLVNRASSLNTFAGNSFCEEDNDGCNEALSSANYWLRVTTWYIHCKIANFGARQATLNDIACQATSAFVAETKLLVYNERYRLPGNIGFCLRDKVASLQCTLIQCKLPSYAV